MRWTIVAVVLLAGCGEKKVDNVDTLRPAAKVDSAAALTKQDSVARDSSGRIKIKVSEDSPR